MTATTTMKCYTFSHRSSARQLTRARNTRSRLKAKHSGSWAFLWRHLLLVQALQLLLLGTSVIKCDNLNIENFDNNDSGNNNNNNNNNDYDPGVWTKPSSDDTKECQVLQGDNMLCKNVQYNATSMPNQYNHANQQEAREAIAQYVGYLQHANKLCRQQIGLFICSMHFPICVQSPFVTILPCRSLCERMRSACHTSMIPWPPSLACDRLKQDDMCSDPFAADNSSIDTDLKDELPVENDQDSILRPNFSDNFDAPKHRPKQPTKRPSFDHGTRSPDETGTEDIRSTTMFTTTQPSLTPPLIISNGQGAKTTAPGRTDLVDGPTKIDNVQRSMIDKCNCLCRAPLISIVDTHDRRYYNQLRVGKVLNCALPCAGSYSSLIADNSNSNFELAETLRPLTDQDQQRLASIMLTHDEKESLRNTLRVLAIICIICTCATLITFVSDTERFAYPARCQVYLCTCYLLVACGYLIALQQPTARVVGAKESPSANNLTNSIPKIYSEPIENTLSPAWHCDADMARYPGVGARANLQCHITFFLVYTFALAACIWWALSTSGWFLAARLEWSHEAIVGLSKYFHVAGWLLPLGVYIVLLANDAIDGDRHTQLCSLGNQDSTNLQQFVIVPEIVTLAVGCMFVALSFRSLFLVPNINPLITGKHQRLMQRVGLFCALYIIPKLALIASLLFEDYSRPHREHNFVCSCPSSASNAAIINQVSPDIGSSLASRLQLQKRNPPQTWSRLLSPTMLSYYAILLRHSALLIVGIACSAWLCFNRKTLSSWRRLAARFSCSSADTTVSSRSLILANGANHKNNTNELGAVRLGIASKPDALDYYPGNLGGAPPLPPPTTLIPSSPDHTNLYDYVSDTCARSVTRSNGISPYSGNNNGRGSAYQYRLPAGYDVPRAGVGYNQQHSTSGSYRRQPKTTVTGQKTSSTSSNSSPRYYHGNTGTSSHVTSASSRSVFGTKPLAHV